MKLPESTKSEIKKDESGENVPQSEITEVIIIYKIQESFVYLFLINRLVNYISPKNFVFLITFDSEFSHI